VWRQEPIVDEQLIKAAYGLDLCFDPIGIEQGMCKEVDGSAYINTIDRQLKTAAVFEKQKMLTPARRE